MVDLTPFDAVNLSTLLGMDSVPDDVKVHATHVVERIYSADCSWCAGIRTIQSDKSGS